MSKHTPGPWHVELGGFVYSKTKKVADVGLNGGYFASRISAEPERTANARLIAAAPELLEALEALLADHEKYCEHGSFESADAARAAIAKALVTEGDK